MNIKPLADRVLILPAPAEEKTIGGIIIPDTAKEKPLQGEVHGICASRNDNLDKCPHGDQRRKQTAKRHILRMFPAPRNCFFSHLFSSIMHDAFFHKRFLSWHAATVPADFRCPCMFPFAQNESSSITPTGIYGSSAQAQDSPSVLQSDKRVLHPPAT